MSSVLSEEVRTILSLPNRAKVVGSCVWRRVENKPDVIQRFEERWEGLRAEEQKRIRFVKCSILKQTEYIYIVSLIYTNF